MTFDFIIVGAGMAGASLAYELSRSSRVCVLEAETQPGVHATGRSAALFAPSYGGAEIRAVTRASQAFFAQPPEGFCDHPLLHARGCLFIGRADQAPRLRRMLDEIANSGGALAPISREQAFARVPLLRPQYLDCAAFDPNAMDIDVAELHQGFLRGARRAGAVLRLDARISEVERRWGLWTIPVQESVVEAPILINAAGAWADQVAMVCGARGAGLRPLRRTAMIVDAPDGVDPRSWPAVIDAEEAFYFKPESGRLLLSPADETPAEPGDAQPDEMDIAIGVERTQAALDIEVRRIRQSWAGLRTFAADRVPVVGYDPEVEGLFWCAGQGGYGIQTAPALARVAAALALDAPPPSDVLDEGLVVAGLSPARVALAQRADLPVAG